jgi:HSP20 family molecular chaperone IbpA
MSLLPFRSLLDDRLDHFGHFGNDWLIHDPFRQEFFGGMKSGTGLDLTKPFSPLLAMDIVENEKGYQLMADLPGVDTKDLELSVENNAIVMKAERKHVHEQKTDKLHRLERSYGSVKRKVLLPKNADMSKADTHFSNGVLTVTIPKLAEVPPSTRKLEIRTAEAVAAVSGHQP